MLCFMTKIKPTQGPVLNLSKEISPQDPCHPMIQN